MTRAEKTLRSAGDLAAAGLVAEDEAMALDAVARRYAVALTPALARLVDPADPADPIARQFVPSLAELHTLPEERADPIGDHVHEKLPGLVHRYPDRVLLKVTLACPVYCRFCFRREMVGPGGPPPMQGAALERAIDYIAGDPGIREVILTGGDPLMLSPRRIEDISRRLAAVPSVSILRWHTRVPVADPGRIDAEMAGALAFGDKAVWLAVHVNHPRELSPEARSSLQRLRSAGIVVVAQTVLLKGVNDDAGVLAELFTGLVAEGVKPYYLHQADLAPGTAHFRTTLAEGQAIMRALRGRISGLALPTYVLDIPGGHGKVPVGPAHVDPVDGHVTDVAGVSHPYPDTIRDA